MIRLLIPLIARLSLPQLRIPGMANSEKPFIYHPHARRAANVVKRGHASFALAAIEPQRARRAFGAMINRAFPDSSLFRAR